MWPIGHSVWGCVSFTTPTNDIYKWCPLLSHNNNNIDYITDKVVMVSNCMHALTLWRNPKRIEWSKCYKVGQTSGARRRKGWKMESLQRWDSGCAAKMRQIVVRSPVGSPTSLLASVSDLLDHPQISANQCQLQIWLTLFLETLFLLFASVY